MNLRAIWAASPKSVFVSIGASIVLVVACSSSEDAAPGRTITPAPVGTTDAGGADAVAEADPSCTTAEGCFSCEPAVLADFLNACTEGQCAPFDNVARLPLYEPGKPLPAIP